MTSTRQKGFEIGSPTTEIRGVSKCPRTLKHPVAFVPTKLGLGIYIYCILIGMDLTVLVTSRFTCGALRATADQWVMFVLRTNFLK